MASKGKNQLQLDQGLGECHLVFGAIGQDGSYLSEQLCSEGKEVIGVIRPNSIIPEKYKHQNINYVRGDILDDDFILALLETYSPSHVYNLASASSVAESYLNSDLSKKINLDFVEILISNIEKYQNRYKREVFLLQASSSEMFGPDNKSPINEFSPHDPRSPYAEHKSIAHRLCQVARTDSNIRVGTAILFNHESPRRPLKFVSRKISRGAFLISNGLENKLILGNINVFRDWGYAPDYVGAMRIIALKTYSDDFVISTGKLHSLEEMCAIAFEAVGISNYKSYVQSDKSLYRTIENSGLKGDSKKINDICGWAPTVTFDQMVKKMVSAESIES